MKKKGMKETPTKSEQTKSVNDVDQTYPTLSALNCLSITAVACKIYNTVHIIPNTGAGIFSDLIGLIDL